MCAIGGVLNRQSDVSPRLLNQMLEVQRHRGPDGSGVFSDKNLSFLHARLAIQDLSNHSHQPYVSDRFVIVFNGEIYNFVELRDFLVKKFSLHFVSTGDVEVLTKGIECLGQAFISQLNGDFAIAVYDRLQRKLWLARDRVGVKPLYYSKTSEQFSFASEIKALFIANSNREIDEQALHSYFAFRYVRGTQTVFKNVYRVEPGHILEVDRNLNISQKSYWNPFSNTPSIPRTELRDLFFDSTHIRARSLRPASLLLSGGMDSTLLLAVLNGQQKIVREAFTFNHLMEPYLTIDAQRARDFAIAQGVDLTIVHRGSEDLKTLLLQIEEPIADAVIWPLRDLLRAASQNYRVIFSGEGADEVFAGYGHHGLMGYLQRLKWLLPLVAKALPRNFALVAINKLNHVYPGKISSYEYERILKASLGLDEFVDSYHSIVEIFDPSERADFLETSLDLKHQTHQFLQPVKEQSFLKKLLFLEMKTWLTNYNLMKVDKIAGQFGAEVRVPYLDHRIIEWLFQSSDEGIWQWHTRKPILVDLCDQLNVPTPRKVPFVYNDQELMRDWKTQFDRSTPFRALDCEKAKRQLQQIPQGILRQKKIQSLYLWQQWESAWLS